MDAGGATGVEWTRFTLSGGSVVEGEVIAVYDHSRWWWDAASEETYAVFDPAGLAPWPDDVSMRFLSSEEVLAAETFSAASRTPSHRRALRETGITLLRSPLNGDAYVITAGESYHLEENGYGDFAWDLVRRADDGTRFEGDGSTNEQHRVWNEEVVSPVSGIVVELVSDAPDLPPGEPDLDAVNNLVGIQVYGGYYVYLLHLRQDSVPPEVAIGARVEVGQLLGRVGNSGVTAEPHLHVAGLALQPGSDPLRTWSVPVEWRNLSIRDADGTREEAWASPPSGVWVSNAER